MEAIETTAVLNVGDRSMVAESRRHASALAHSFSDEQRGRLDLVVTELATNLLKHAGGGRLLFTANRDAAGGYIDLIAIDTGPGIVDVRASLRDGHSTAGSAGTGLGAIRRMSERFDVYSDSSGTSLYSRIRAQASAVSSADRFDLCGICVAHPAEIVPGDAWMVHLDGQCITAVVIDGLGHGPLARDAALAGIAAFDRARNRSPAQIMDEIHAALRSTRGAVAGVARLEASDDSVTFAGVGNVSAIMASNGDVKHLVSHNGTLGAQVRLIREVRSPAPPNSTLILHSDGLSTHLDLNRYPGLLTRSAGVITGVLYRDLSRGRDDATLVVIRRVLEQ